MAGKIIDSIVTVSVTDSTGTADAAAVNTVAALVYVAPATDGEESYVKAVTITSSSEAADYGDDAAAIATSFFAEDNPGELTLVLTNTAIGSASVAGLLDEAVAGDAADCYHWVLRFSSLADMTTDGEENPGLALVQALNAWASENDRLVHVEIHSTDDDATPQDDAAELMTAIASLAPERVAVYSHSADSYSLAAATCAKNCADDPAKGTWAYTQLDGVAADSITVTSFTDYVQGRGLNVYHTVKGLNVLTFGTTGSATSFIDQVVKQDWLKFRVQEAILTLLVTANGNRGVFYSDAGIQGIAAAVNGVLNTAHSNGYIMDDWEVTAPLYADIEAAQIKKRNVPDIAATFQIMNAVHTVQTVKLVITL